MISTIITLKAGTEKRTKLLFTDTDSLCYEIETEDIYKELWEDKNLFGNSDYPKESPFFDSTDNKSSRYAYCGICWAQE